MQFARQPCCSPWRHSAPSGFSTI